MSFRIPDSNQQYTLASGELCAGGSLTFTNTGTSTPRSVYAEPALSTDLGNVITLGSDGRPSSTGSPTDLWGDTGSYRMTLKDSAGSIVSGWPRDSVQGGDFGGIVIPNPTSGTAGQVLGTTGAVYALRDIIEVPDPTGHDGDYLSASGGVPIYITPPTLPSYTIPATGIAVTGTTVIRIGTIVIQIGTGTFPASGGGTSTVNVVFASAGGIAMASCGHVSVQPSQTSNSFMVGTKVYGLSGTGFSVDGSANIFASGNFTSTVTFTYIAWGVSV